MENVGSVAPADTAGGSPVIVPRTPVERPPAVSDANDDVYIEASSSRYYLQDDEQEEPCCWGLLPFTFCRSPQTELNEALLQTPTFATAANESPTSVCCSSFRGRPNRGLTERHMLPRLSSNLLGFSRQTPNGSARVSSPSMQRQRSASSHNDASSQNGTPQRLIRGMENRTGQIEVVRKVVMLGARNSGKSSVVHRFAERRFGAAYDPTIESTIRAKINIKGINFLCDVIDTAGQDEYSSFSRQATVGVHGYCMVFSVTSLQSFQAIQKIRDRIAELVGSYTVPIVLVGTKSDDETHREVSSAAGESLAEAWGAAYVECSAKSDFGIEDVFTSLLYEIERDSGLLAIKDSDNSESAAKPSMCIVS